MHKFLICTSINRFPQLTHMGNTWVFFVSSKYGLSSTFTTVIPEVHGANMGPIWGQQDPGGPHVGPMNLAIWDTWAVSRFLTPAVINIAVNKNNISQLDIMFHVLALTIARSHNALCSWLWCHHQNMKRASETQSGHGINVWRSSFDHHLLTYYVV